MRDCCEWLWIERAVSPRRTINLNFKASHPSPAFLCAGNPLFLDAIVPSNLLPVARKEANAFSTQAPFQAGLRPVWQILSGLGPRLEGKAAAGRTLFGAFLASR